MNNILIKSVLSLGKLIILIALGYMFLTIFFVENTLQLIIGFFVLIFITLPTVFIMFFKKKFLTQHGNFVKFWNVFRVFYVIFIVLYVCATILGYWHLNEVDKTKKAVDFINSKKITIDDVMGKNLPPAPNQKLNDATIAGIDANKNYIRDDVELAIFAKYPNSAKIRAAELQYAQALQLELTKARSRETYIAVKMKKESAYQCLGYAIRGGSDYSKTSRAQNFLGVVGFKDVELNELAVNTPMRAQKYFIEDSKYRAPYISPMDNYCDIDISLLPD